MCCNLEFKELRVCWQHTDNAIHLEIHVYTEDAEQCASKLETKSKFPRIFTKGKSGITLLN